jgi:hypothetical protein
LCEVQPDNPPENGHDYIFICTEGPFYRGKTVKLIPLGALRSDKIFYKDFYKVYREIRPFWWRAISGKSAIALKFVRVGENVSFGCEAHI